MVPLRSVVGNLEYTANLAHVRQALFTVLAAYIGM